MSDEKSTSYKLTEREKLIKQEIKQKLDRKQLPQTLLTNTSGIQISLTDYCILCQRSDFEVDNFDPQQLRRHALQIERINKLIRPAIQKIDQSTAQAKRMLAQRRELGPSSPKQPSEKSDEFSTNHDDSIHPGTGFLSAQDDSPESSKELKEEKEEEERSPLLPPLITKTFKPAKKRHCDCQNYYDPWLRPFYRPI